MTHYRVSFNLFRATFAHFVECGRGHRECQVLWVSPWADPQNITAVVHPKHRAHLGGFVVDDAWLSGLWVELARKGTGIRVQVHTHPREAFHSKVDDDFPIVHSPGFLSLVIPNFGLGRPSFDDAYLTEIQPDGTWRQVAIRERLTVM